MKDKGEGNRASTSQSLRIIQTAVNIPLHAAKNKPRNIHSTKNNGRYVKISKHTLKILNRLKLYPYVSNCICIFK